MLFRPVLMLIVGFLISGASSAAETFSLREDASSGVSWRVTSTVNGEGTFEFQPPGDEKSPVTHPVTIDATFRFVERRLPPAGREEAAYRAFRHYEAAQSSIRVGGQSSAPRLRDERTTIVSRASRSGVLAYSPNGPLTSTEVELLPFPGDPLLLAALFPDREVSVGESWTPPAWTGPALAGAEVALNSKLTCRLDSVRDGQATVRVAGEIEGATKGATSKTKLTGAVTYDLTAKTVVAAKIVHEETRSIGPLSPGMTLKLVASVERSPALGDAALSESAVADIPLELPPNVTWIEHATPFGVTLAGDRGWQVFHQTDKLLILRLLDHGGLIAQCNVAPAPTVPRGQRTPGRLLEEAVRKSLGEQFTEIVETEELDAGGELAVYRVTVAGKAEDSKRLWRYYLVTAPDGRQVELVFTLEPDHVPRLAERDLNLVSSIQFGTTAAPTPAK